MNSLQWYRWVPEEDLPPGHPDNQVYMAMEPEPESPEKVGRLVGLYRVSSGQSCEDYRNMTRGR
jgi:hypothetical protein